MGRFKLKLKRLEKRQGKRRVIALEFDPADLADGPVSDDLPVRVVGYWRAGENAVSGRLGAFSGHVILFPSITGGAAAWEAAAAAQQRALIAHARSRTDEPGPAPVASVGTIAEDVPAPKRKGEKGKRFIELADGTFDTATRQYVNEDGKPIAKAGGLSVVWKGGE